MLVWAGPPEKAPEHPDVILWSGAAKRSGTRSIAGYIETHAEEIRRRYLAWFQEFGELQIRGRPLCSRFTSTDGMSIWPLSQFVELSPWRQAAFDKLIKVFALERMIEDEAPAAVTFVGADRAVQRALKVFCAGRGISYAWTQLPSCSLGQFGALMERLPHPMQGVIAQAYLAATRLGLGRPSLRPPRGPRKRVLICAPLFNQEFEPGKSQEFGSRYWTTLPRMLIGAGYDVHWLHIAYPHDKVPTVRAAGKMLEYIQAAPTPMGTHSLLDSHLTMGTVARIFGKWLRIAMQSLWVGSLVRRRLQHGHSADYWPLIREDWARAFRGTACAQSLFYAECKPTLRCGRSSTRMRVCI